MPTLLDVLGVEAPATIKGHVQSPFDGVSMRASLDDASSPSPRKTQFYAMLGSRSIWHEGWKAVTTHPVLAGWGHFNDDEWELYHIDVDRAETHNLAAEHPDKVRELVNLWFSEAGANEAFPLDDRSAVEIINTPRPQLTAPRDRYVYRPGTAPVPEWQAVNMRGRSYVIGALVDIPAPGAARRAVRLRVALRRPRPLRQGQPPASTSTTSSASWNRRSSAPRTCRSGTTSSWPHRSRRTASKPTTPAGPSRSTTATAWSAQAKIKTQLGAFAIAGAPLYVGRHVGEPVTDDYPGQPPYAFTGGTIDRVAVDVSGEPFVDLEREAQLMIMRE